jgi:hypothetical protein
MIAGNNNNPWSVFASSWNPGQTMPVYYYYDVTVPIPANYTVTFQVWASNLTPVIPDSCYFDTTFTINLNPIAVAINTVNNKTEWNIVADAAQHSLLISWEKPLQKPITISLLTITGSKIFETHPSTGTLNQTIDEGKLQHGTYLVSIEGENINRVVRKITW